MLINKLTLQSTLALTILLIGLVGLSLVLSTESTYHEFALQHQEKALENLIAIKVDDLTSELVEHQKQLAFRLQAEDQFKDTYNNRDITNLVYWLDQEFNRYFVTTGLLKLEKIIIFDEELNKVTSSERGIPLTRSSTIPCSALSESVKALSVSKRVKPHSQICNFNGKPLLSTLISIGSLRPKGYIQIISDPAHMFAHIENELGTHLQITAPDGLILHQSSTWPAEATGNRNYLFSSYTVNTSSGEPALTIISAANIKGFNAQLGAKRAQVIAFALLLITMALLIALYIMRKGLKPLKDLESAAHSIGEGAFVSVDEKGFPEVSTPIRSFNHMTHEIQSLIQNLQNEVEQHEQTELKLRDAKEQAEQHALVAENQKNFSQLTLQSIVDAVVTTDTSGYITSMNPMAEQLSGWTEDDALGKPMIQVMHMLFESTRKRIYDPIENIEHKTVLDEPVSAILIQNESDVETPIEYIAVPMRNNADEIIGIVIIIHDESVQRSLNRQLTFQATHDALTGLINRYELERRLKNILNTPASEERPNTLCYMDLDQFKLVNDTCGHTAGDELLKQITMLLQERVREKDTLARLGGDEFGLLLENCDIQQAQTVAEDLIETIKFYSFNWDEYNFSLGVSIGIVAITSDMTSVEDILKSADSACYLAKDSGRNRIQVYTTEDDKLITQQREMHWVSRINHALEENRFKLYFQKILPLTQHGSKFMHHGEVLLRMVDKEGDLISPSAFMPAAERYNMIRMIDEWVVENTIQWLARRKKKVLVSVNLSGKSLSDKNFLNFVVTKLKEYNINPELVCFEVTETAAISHLTTAIHFMTVLKKLGCSFALDDFGSGLSSFSYLTSLPVDYLKIDGSFVVDIDKDPMHYAMVKSINEVGQVMGIRTIAEYAASENIINSLKEIGVDNAQGYAVAKPVPLDAIDDNNVDKIDGKSELKLKSTTNITKLSGD